MSLEDDPFPPEALEANRTGRLTDAQRRRARARSHGIRWTELWYGLVAAALFVIMTGSIAAGRKAGLAIIVFDLACGLIGAVLLYRAATGADRLTHDLRSPRVESIEGAILKRAAHLQDQHGTAETAYYITVAGQQSRVDEQTFEAAPAAGYVRLYFLPRSKHVVNLERLPDRPVPANATLGGLTTHAFKTAFTGNFVERAEANAALASLGRSIVEEYKPPDSPPPPEVRDPRPLGEAIVGTWTNPFMGFRFTSDGKLQLVHRGHEKDAGRWFVDAAGKLHAEIDGRQTDIDAWIVGDHLTIAFGEKPLVLKRG